MKIFSVDFCDRIICNFEVETANISCRKLTLKDSDAVENLYLRNRTWMGVQIDDAELNENLELAKTKYLSEKSQNQILIGAFLDGNLVISCGLYFWEKTPFCSILRLVSEGTEKYSFKTLEKAYQEIFKFIFSEMRQRNRNRFYILTNLQHQSSLALMAKRMPEVWQEYDMAIEEIILESRHPQFEYVWDMMGQRTWPTTLVLRTGTLKNEYRSFNDQLLSKKITQWWPNCKFLSD